jgi:hypothetical protein
MSRTRYMLYSARSGRRGFDLRITGAPQREALHAESGTRRRWPRSPSCCGGQPRPQSSPTWHQDFRIERMISAQDASPGGFACTLPTRGTDISRLLGLSREPRSRGGQTGRAGGLWQTGWNGWSEFRARRGVCCRLPTRKWSGGAQSMPDKLLRKNEDWIMQRRYFSQ